jgi:hypothetical protein
MHGHRLLRFQPPRPPSTTTTASAQVNEHAQGQLRTRPASFSSTSGSGSTGERTATTPMAVFTCSIRTGTSWSTNSPHASPLTGLQANGTVTVIPTWRVRARVPASVPGGVWVPVWVPMQVHPILDITLVWVRMLRLIKTLTSFTWKDHRRRPGTGVGWRLGQPMA